MRRAVLLGSDSKFVESPSARGHQRDVEWRPRYWQNRCARLHQGDGAPLVTKIEVVGGLPDELDGNLQHTLPCLAEVEQPEAMLRAAAEEP